MIENDEQFKEVFRKYLISKGADINSFISCEDIDCNDCVLGNLKDRHGFNVCLREPFKEMEKLKEDIELLKKEIEIMEMWEAETESDLARELQDICNILKSRAKDPKCPTNVCEKCPFYNINSFSFWLIYTRNQMNRQKRGEEND